MELVKGHAVIVLVLMKVKMLTALLLSLLHGLNHGLSSHLKGIQDPTHVTLFDRFHLEG